MNPRYPEVARRARFRCEYCLAPEKVFNGTFDLEHIHPTSLGGTSEQWNLALGCGPCNKYKSNAIDAVDPVSGERVALFHPRTQAWDDHFHVADSDHVEGVTATGRATVAQLRLNAPRQIHARRYCRLVNLFP